MAFRPPNSLIYWLSDNVVPQRRFRWPYLINSFLVKEGNQVPEYAASVGDDQFGTVADCELVLDQPYIVDLEKFGQPAALFEPTILWGSPYHGTKRSCIPLPSASPAW